MKTIKRKANVGERIIITNADPMARTYTNGNMFIVKDNEGGYVETEGKLMNHDEYEVIIEEADEMDVIEKMQAEIAELKSKVAALEGSKYGKMADLSKGKGEIILPNLNCRHTIKPKSPQKIRDEIVAKAKADAAALIDHGKEANTDPDVMGNATYRTSFYRVEFVVAKEKRTVVALIKGATWDGRVFDVRHRGIAKADPSDCFNVHIGKAIALRRALGLEVPAEYYNAPAPTEVRVGDKIRTVGGEVYEVTEEFTWDADKLSLDFCGGTIRKSKIIDDSREDL